jgi:hypothetical protein
MFSNLAGRQDLELYGGKWIKGVEFGSRGDDGVGVAVYDRSRVGEGDGGLTIFDPGWEYYNQGCWKN